VDYLIGQGMCHPCLVDQCFEVIHRLYVNYQITPLKRLTSVPLPADIAPEVRSFHAESY